MLYCRGCGLVAAVGQQRPPWLMDATIPIVEESSPPVPFPPSSSPPPPHIVPKRRGSTIDSARRRSSETAPIPTMLLLLTSPEIIANLRYKSYVFLRTKNENTTHRPH